MSGIGHGEINHQQDEHHKGEKNRTDIGMAEQEKQSPDIREETPAVPVQHANGKEQQRAYRIIPGDHGPFIAEIISACRQDPYNTRERGKTQKQKNGCRRNQNMRDLHSGRIGPEMRRNPYQQMPESGMPLILHIDKQVPWRRRTPGKEPGLDFIPPHFMVHHRGTEQHEKEQRPPIRQEAKQRTEETVPAMAKSAFQPRRTAAAQSELGNPFQNRFLP